MKCFLYFLFISSLFFSCSQSEKPSRQNTLNISFYTDPPAIDPRKTGHFVDSTLSFMLFSGLQAVKKDSSIGEGIATSYEVSSDGTLYTFHLREAYWSDGKPITAYDFEKSWKAIIDPKFPSLTSKLFYCIKNAEAASNNQRSLDDVGVKALDEKTLIVELEYPAPYFLHLTAFCAYFPAPSHVVETNPNWDKNPTESFVCSGPFKLVKWTPKKELIVEKNPKFWGEDHVNLQKIRIQILSDSNTALQMFEENQLDWIGSAVSPIPYHAENQFKNAKGFQKRSIAGTAFLSFNIKEFPFHNVHIRKAFSSAIDRKAIVDSVTFSNQSFAGRIIPTSFEFNQEDTLISDNDPVMAQRHLQIGLKELGLSKDQLKITLHFHTDFMNKKVVETIQRQIKEALDIKITLIESDHPTHMSTVRGHQHQISLMKWIFQYYDVMNIFTRFKEQDDPLNYSYWKNDEFLSLLTEINHETDPQRRYQKILKAEEIFLEDMPITPLFHLRFLTVTKDKVQDVVIGEVGDLFFEYAKKKDGVL